MRPVHSARCAGIFGAVVYALTACAPARADWLFDVDIGFVHDSNLTRAANADAVRGDGAWNASASLGYLVAASADSVFTVGSRVIAQRYGRYRPLDHVEIGLQAFYRHKLGVGANVPYLIAALAVAHDDYRDDLRDSDRASGYAEAGRRFDAAIDIAAGVGFDRRNQHRGVPLVAGISGSVFDLRGQSAWVRAAYALSDDVEIGARAAARRGDVESTAHRGPAIFRASDAIARDRAFGENDLYAYRLRGTTWTTALTLSWALSAHAAISADYIDERTHAAEGLDYRSRVARLSVAYRH